jgi:hypothetical protein
MRPLALCFLLLAGASTTAAQAPAKAKPAGGSVGARAAAPDSAVVIMREVFAYGSNGRRDPFVSLMTTGEIRPLITDLALIGVIYDDESPRRSVAILTDGSTGKMYRASVGQAVGRMTVARIGKQDITMAIDEFGLSRQQVLTIDKTPKADAKSNTPRRTP